MQPLSHIRVLDLSRILAGPWAGQMLADLGAEVIKIERPGRGDDTRSWGPPFLHDADGNETSDAAYFFGANRGKKSVTIDFTKPAGSALVRKLVENCDIVLENYKVGGLAKYGLDYANLQQINPRLIYCSITGFGQNGPYSKRAGYDFLIQGMGGLMSLTGLPDDEPGGGPMKTGVAIIDIFAGLYASNAVLASLMVRDRTGKGQYIDLSLLDVQVATLANQAMNYLVSGEIPNRYGNAHPNIVPYQAFPTEDSHLILAIGNDDQFRKFCIEAGCPELADDKRYATNAARVDNRVDLLPILKNRLKTRTKAQWIKDLETIGVPCGPINELDEVFADPQIVAREMCINLDRPATGSVSLVANPIKFSETPIAYGQAPPLLGEHNLEIFQDQLGLSDKEISELLQTGVIGGGSGEPVKVVAS